MTQDSFKVLDAAIPSDASEWLASWKSWPQREVFFHPDFVRLYADKKNRALCATFRSKNANVLYPFLLRDLTAESYWNPDDPPAHDITTPFGWGGASFWGTTDSRKLAEEFWRQFEAWVIAQNIVSEYVQFALFPEILLPYPGEKFERIQHVIRDLNLDEEVIWMDFQHKVRKNVKKAKNSGVTIELDPIGKRLYDFLLLYRETMVRRNGSSFPREYFDRIHCGLPGQFIYFHAIHEESVISTELVLLSVESAYSFLGGTDTRMLSLRPNDLLKYEIILWAKKQGLRRFILGGGNEADDGIFRYKLPFAPNGCRPRYEGRRVFRQDLYNNLITRRRALMEKEERKWAPRPEYFPLYRG